MKKRRLRVKCLKCIPEDKVAELGLSEKDIIDIDILKKEKVSGFGIAKGKKPFEREEPEHEDL